MGQTAVYIDSAASNPYRLHFYEITVRGQTTRGEETTVHAELAAVHEEIADEVAGTDRFGLVPADVLIDLPAHPRPPESLPDTDYGPVSDYVKTTLQMDRRRDAQAERGRYADVARDYLQRSFDARVRAAQDRVMRLRAREPKEPEVALARQRAEQDLADLKRTGATHGWGGSACAWRNGPVQPWRVVCLAPNQASTASGATRGLDAAYENGVIEPPKDVVVAYERSRTGVPRVGSISRIGLRTLQLQRPTADRLPRSSDGGSAS